MNITKKIPKFIAIASNLSAVSYRKAWTYIALTNTTEKMAIAEGVHKGFNIGCPFSVCIAKKIREEENGMLVYKSILRVYHNGAVQRASQEPVGEWYAELADIDFE